MEADGRVEVWDEQGACNEQVSEFSEVAACDPGVRGVTSVTHDQVQGRDLCNDPGLAHVAPVQRESSRDLVVIIDCDDQDQVGSWAESDLVPALLTWADWTLMNVADS